MDAKHTPGPWKANTINSEGDAEVIATSTRCARPGPSAVGKPAELMSCSDGLRRIINELDCRIEHGADGAVHLRYIQEQLVCLVLRLENDRLAAAKKPDFCDCPPGQCTCGPDGGPCAECAGGGVVNTAGLCCQTEKVWYGDVLMFEVPEGCDAIIVAPCDLQMEPRMVLLPHQLTTEKLARLISELPDCREVVVIPIRSREYLTVWQRDDFPPRKILGAAQPEEKPAARLTPHGRIIHEKNTIDVSGFPYPPETLDNEPEKPAGGGEVKCYNTKCSVQRRGKCSVLIAKLLADQVEMARRGAP